MTLLIYLCMFVVVTILIAIVFFDLKWRIIPNWLNLALLIMAFIWCLLNKNIYISKDLLVPIALHISVTYAAFHFGVIGGGDFKMLVAAFGFIWPDGYVGFWFLVAFAGAILAAVQLVLIRMTSSKPRYNSVAYGVPIALGIASVLVSKIPIL